MLELMEQWIEKHKGVKLKRLNFWNVIDDCTVLDHMHWDIGTKDGTIRVSSAFRKPGIPHPGYFCSADTYENKFSMYFIPDKNQKEKLYKSLLDFTDITLENLEIASQLI